MLRRSQEWQSKASGNKIEKCNICGAEINFDLRRPIENLREEEICPYCHAIMRYLDMAQVLLYKSSISLQMSIKEALPIFNDMYIYELAHGGSINMVLSTTPHHTTSEFFDDVKPGQYHASGIRCENVQALTFTDNIFDYVISQDVFEHVPDFIQGFKEIKRVLKPGGYHLFTVPYHNNAAKSVVRAKVENGKIKYLLKPMYHGDPIRPGGALVFVDYGLDLGEMLVEIGFNIEIYESVYNTPNGGYNVVFCAQKLA